VLPRNVVPRGHVACCPLPLNRGRFPPPLPCPPPRPCPPTEPVLRYPVVVSELIILVLSYCTSGSRLYGARQVFVPLSVRIRTWSRTRCVIVALLLFSTSLLSQRLRQFAGLITLLVIRTLSPLANLLCARGSVTVGRSCSAHNCASTLVSVASGISVLPTGIQRLHPYPSTSVLSIGTFLSKQCCKNDLQNRPYGKA
jgi:hypothetical protein